MTHRLPDTLMLTLSSHLELGKSRLQTLSWLIIGVINARTVNLSHVASQFAGAAQIGSSYRRLQRFFQYVRLEGDWLAVAVVNLMKSGRVTLRVSRNWKRWAPRSSESSRCSHRNDQPDLTDISQMASRIAEIIPPYHRRKNRSFRILSVSSGFISTQTAL